MASDDGRPHPYLIGNHSPVRKEWPLTPCVYVGTIPQELYGGQYIRNGANPFHTDSNSLELESRGYHWFDGDGMLTGVYFQRSISPTPTAQNVVPYFVNAYILTDLHLHARASPFLKRPILPSISMFLNPLTGTIVVIVSILRAIVLVILSRLAVLGSRNSHGIYKISVANTSILYHDGRALATCESGPPMRILLPSLDTIGWFDGTYGDGDNIPINEERAFGLGSGLVRWMNQWTTGHPRIDPHTKEMILYHSTVIPPYLSYTIIPASSSPLHSSNRPRVRNAPIPGVHSPKLTHDFACTLTHTIMLDLPLYLDPRNLLSALVPSGNHKPIMHYEPNEHARFGIFPRYEPDKIRWFDDVEGGSCCIFHTVCAWDEVKPGTEEVIAVNLLVCRLDSAALIYSAGNLAIPQAHQANLSAPDTVVNVSKGKCELYYYRFDLSSSDCNRITHAFPLSRVPFEFPVVPPDAGMGLPLVDNNENVTKGCRSPQYVYGCSMQHGTFGAALGGPNARIDAIVKVNVHRLIEQGTQRSSHNSTRRIHSEGDRLAVDGRTVQEILEAQNQLAISNDQDCSEEAICVFALPLGHCGSEPSFCPRANAKSEDDGYLVFFVFDEGQLERGISLDDAQSELWVVDAKNMKDIVCKISLPQRVPYGLHAHFFTEDEILNQRETYSLRTLVESTAQPHLESWYSNVVGSYISWIGGLLG